MRPTLFIRHAMFCAFIFWGIANPGFTQKVARLDPYEAKYAPGVVLVKFDEKIEVPLSKTGKLGKVALTEIQKTLDRYGVVQGENLFPQAQRGERLGKVRNFSGEAHEAESLYNIYRFHFDPQHDAKTVAEELAKQNGVIYAEPDYIFSALETIPNDAFYNQQWHLPAINAPTAWDITTGDTTQLIAILDTGVDWDHPDLDAKIKINFTEYNGAAGVDDDANGYVDDIRGWDFINNDNDPNDDNSHGTHVAGIAAAETNNGTGIAGVSWVSKILPVKILQSTGVGSSSTIAQGVIYARSFGAKVMNLSLGSYTESITLRTALQNAYSSAVIVAAAGNDGKSIDGLLGKPMFPACYGWVLGVEATAQTYDAKYGWRAAFSNFDPSGPIAYSNSYGYNYELKAPGVSIYGTLPNGQYGALSGTSMATPMVSGIVALLKTQQPNISTELLFGNLIKSLGNTLDIYAAMNQTPTPDLRFISYTLVDTLVGDDRDGRPDAGETIQIWLTIKNVWGQADSVWSKLRLGPLEDPLIVSVVDSTSFIINGLSAYAIATGQSDPFRIQLASGLPNNRDIVFQYSIGCQNSSTIITGQFFLTIQKGATVGGAISGNVTWTNANEYIVTADVGVTPGSKLTIEPGTTIRFEPGFKLVVDGQLVAAGKKDSLISFIRNKTGKWGYIELRGSENNAVFDGNGQLISGTILEYVLIEYAGGYYSGVNFGGIKINACSPMIRKSIIRYCSGNNNGAGITGSGNATILQCQIYQNNWQGIESNAAATIKHNALFENTINGSVGGEGIGMSKNCLIEYNNLFKNSRYGIRTYGSYTATFLAEHNWFGTSNSNQVADQVFDYSDDFNRSLLDYTPFLTKPDSLSPAIVWKVLINNQNPQDGPIDPIGTETVRFDVYFNRPMDIAYPPLVTFGVRDPFTQHGVEDNTGWSADSTIWHGYFTVGLETGDGINTIRVEGAKDTDHFEIPIEQTRFKFTIDAAISAASTFTATASIGKVTLNWPKAPTADVLGYNMYRYYNLTDTTYSPIVGINTSLITDTTYTDFAVTPGTAYHYFYKVLGTDMAQSDSSKTVTATPVNAASGDANGDLSVNVLDLVAIVSYILGENPQPFIFGAADVNSDNAINVLDIVGVVNIIIGAPNPKAAAITGDPASLEISPDGIVLKSPVPVYALQFTLTGDDLANCLLQPAAVLNGFELAKSETAERLKVIIYNLKSLTIPAGENKILSLAGGQNLRLTEVILVDRNGRDIPTSVKDNTPVALRFELYPNYPNPFNPSTKIKYGLPKISRVKLTIYNVLGQHVRVFDEGLKPSGFHEMIWDGKDSRGVLVGSGVYFCRFEAGEFAEVKKMLLVR